MKTSSFCPPKPGTGIGYRGAPRITLRRGGRYFTVRAIPIVLVTGHSESEVEERAATAGIFSYLLKPVTRSDLDAAMQIAWACFAELQIRRKQVRDLAET